ncbi:MAG: cupin domain-containing protein [Desulfobacteraceae bacterium]|nr:cupin domain-containing protein [Desulfobacteraceae bacterium]
MENLIKKYDLAPHPEGGYFKEIYRSSQVVQSGIASETRNTVTHIYFLLVKGQVSRFHRVIHDEIWNFYEGAPIKLIQFDTTKIKEDTLGPGCKEYVGIVPGNTWQAAATTGQYSLMGCTVAPGFDFTDFSFLKDDPDELERFRAMQSEYTHFL